MEQFYEATREIADFSKLYNLKWVGDTFIFIMNNKDIQRELLKQTVSPYPALQTEFLKKGSNIKVALRTISKLLNPLY